MGGTNIQSPRQPKRVRAASGASGSASIAGPRHAGPGEGVHPDPSGTGATAISRAVEDLQSLLGGALERLSRTTGNPRCVAWALRDDGRPYAAAAAVREAMVPQPPDPAALEVLWQRPGATDLGAQDLGPELAELTRSRAFAAAAPLHSPGGERLALLVVGGNPEDPPGRVRPRTLAALDEAVERLRGPASSALALSRLASLGREVAHLDRRAALGDLLGEIVHELRNPLVSMKTLIQLLPERRDDPEFYLDFRDLVAEELARMDRLLETLLRHAGPSPDTGDLRGRCRLAPVLESMLRLLEHRAGSRGIRLALEADGALPAVALREDALRQIVLNLVLNALEATPEGGTVRLGCSQRRDRDGSRVELTVDDAGPGIAEEDRGRLFQPFVSSRDGRPGGLGLAISQHLAKEAGGSIAVEDAPEGGARFRLRLPRAADARPGEK
jgi:signal transduction histidine kinase